MSKNFNEAYNEFIQKYEMVGSTVLICNKDKIIANAVSGMKDLEANIPTLENLNTIYRIASISKVIVALGVMLLYDKGLVDINEDISKYLGFKVRNPHFEDDIITLKMVMTQTSSLSDSVYDEINCDDDPYVSLEDLLLNKESKYYNEKTFLKHKPGTFFEYSNFGCGLLACVVERITGEYFPEYIINNLLKPLDINSGFRVEHLMKPEDLATHYFYNNHKFIRNRDYDSFKKVQSPKYKIGDNFRGVAGGLYISAYNLSKIMRMLMNDGIYENKRMFKESTIKLMKEVHWSGVPSDPTYRMKGLQMIIMDNFTEKPLFGHFGNAYGLRSFMLFNEDFGYIFLCNGANFINDVEHMTILQEDVIKFLVSYTKEKNLEK